MIRKFLSFQRWLCHFSKLSQYTRRSNECQIRTKIYQTKKKRQKILLHNRYNVCETKVSCSILKPTLHTIFLWTPTRFPYKWWNKGILANWVNPPKYNDSFFWFNSYRQVISHYKYMINSRQKCALNLKSKIHYIWIDKSEISSFFSKQKIAIWIFNWKKIKKFLVKTNYGSKSYTF